MGFRFFKRINIAPGISMNFSKSGPSFSFGPRGMKYTVGPKGTRSTFGIPGTGLYYTTTNSHKQKKGGKSTPSIPPQSPKPNNSSFFKNLFLSKPEKLLNQGLIAFANNNSEVALNYFRQGSDLADCTFMAGYVTLGRKDYPLAEQFLKECYVTHNQLGQTISKLEGDFELLLDITEYIEAPIEVNLRGLGLVLAEVYQHQDKFDDALKPLEDIWNNNPSDKVICLSLTDLISLSEHSTPQHLKDILDITKDIENDEPIDTNILYLRAYTLYRLGLVDAAIKQLSSITRKTKNRPKTLIQDIRYLRGQMYEDSGENGKARKDYEFIYADDPGYEDVATRLGI